MTRDEDRPARLPTPVQVEAMAGYGLSSADIAKVLDLEEDVLCTTYARELGSGAIKANARVAESLFRKATGEGRESVTAAIFWLKTRARWKEVSVHKHAGLSGQPLVVEITRFADRRSVDRTAGTSSRKAIPTEWP